MSQKNEDTEDLTNVSQDLLENLDMLINMSLLEEEKNWEVLEYLEEEDKDQKGGTENE